MRVAKSPLFLGVALLIGFAAQAPAQSAPIQGTFSYSAQESGDIDQAIREATGRMNFALRAIARPRLKKTNEAYRKVTIAPSGSSVTITTDSRAPITTPASGTPIRWKREDGETLDVSTVWQDGRLKQSFVAEDGRRDNVYTLSPDGRTLTMDVTVTSGRLPQPVTYKLVYKRDS